MKTILLTEFEPFLHYKTNPIMKIAEELHGNVFGQYKICIQTIVQEGYEQ